MPECLKARQSQSEPNPVSNAPKGKLEVRRRQGLSLSTSARVGEMSPFKQGPLRLREGAQNRPTIQARLGRRLACDDEPSLWVEGSDSPGKYGSFRKRGLATFVASTVPITTPVHRIAAMLANKWSKLDAWLQCGVACKSSIMLAIVPS